MSFAGFEIVAEVVVRMAMPTAGVVALLVAAGGSRSMLVLASSLVLVLPLLASNDGRTEFAL